MPQLLTIEDLEEYLRFTRKSIYKLLKRGALPAIKIGNKWRFDKKEIDRWLRQSAGVTKARILVIDDDEIVASVFRETLQEEGHVVVTVDTGVEGLEQVKQSDFDLVFLDLKMPDMDGAEVLGQIRKIKPELPVTIVTGYPDSEMMQRALRYGPLGIMAKPVDVADITTAANSSLHAIGRH